MVVGGLAPMISQEAVIAGGAGVAPDVMNALTTAVGVIGTAVGP